MNKKVELSERTEGLLECLVYYRKLQVCIEDVDFDENLNANEKTDLLDRLQDVGSVLRSQLGLSIEDALTLSIDDGISFNMNKDLFFI